MPVTHLRIDTSIASADPSSTRAHRDGLRTPASARSTASSSYRLRSASSASTSSALSPASRAPSSASHLSVKSAQRSMPTTPTSAAAPRSPSWPVLDSGSEDEGGAESDEYVLAMHDFAPQQSNVTCLTFRAGQVIRVLNRDTSGWWDGELDGRRGWFPSNYVTSEVGLLTDEELPGGKVSSIHPVPLRSSARESMTEALRSCCCVDRALPSCCPAKRGTLRAV